MTQVCRRYGISRQTGYKWVNRYRREGPDGLEERSRRPHSCPLATAEELVMAVLEMRQAHPRRGPKKLHVMLQRKYGEQTPSVATIARVLKRFGMVRQRGRFRRLSIEERAPHVRATGCNDIWTVDFKGWWLTQDRRRYEPLTVRDAYSRYVLAVRHLRSNTVVEVRRVFQRLFRKHGLPQCIQCDNGAPFIIVQARGGLTRLSAWWVSLGIGGIRSRPGCPQDNGGHERVHRDIQQDVQAFPAPSLIAQQRACDRWRQEFNHVRPHEALGGKTPAELYQPSTRQACKTEPVFPSHWLTRHVSANGTLRARSVQLFIGRALAGHRVALQPLDTTRYRLWFRSVDLGVVTLPLADSLIDVTAHNFLASQNNEAA